MNSTTVQVPGTSYKNGRVNSFSTSTIVPEGTLYWLLLCFTCAQTAYCTTLYCIVYSEYSVESTKRVDEREKTSLVDCVRLSTLTAISGTSTVVIRNGFPFPALISFFDVSLLYLGCHRFHRCDQ